MGERAAGTATEEALVFVGVSPLARHGVLTRQHGSNHATRDWQPGLPRQPKKLLLWHLPMLTCVHLLQVRHLRRVQHARYRGRLRHRLAGALWQAGGQLLHHLLGHNRLLRRLHLKRSMLGMRLCLRGRLFGLALPLPRARALCTLPVSRIILALEAEVADGEAKVDDVHAVRGSAQVAPGMLLKRQAGDDLLALALWAVALDAAICHHGACQHGCSKFTILHALVCEDAHPEDLPHRPPPVA
mmetsp:Transcript_18189/g.46024  ORF Transcript_18189/g.46024 Transcript_18189/m.46024 type:complete len:243 (+) Transcript_18189:760-1488(+)